MESYGTFIYREPSPPSVVNTFKKDWEGPVCLKVTHKALVIANMQMHIEKMSYLDTSDTYRSNKHILPTLCIVNTICIYRH